VLVFREPINTERIRRRFVELVYADHNRQPRVREALGRVLASIPREGVGLNVGAGRSRVDPKVLNLDIAVGADVDILAKAQSLPIRSDAVDVIVSQETLEHVAEPFEAIAEINRVLKPGGLLYLQLPFTIGYHPGPDDFWRFTREGIEQLVSSCGLRVLVVDVAVGASTGFYRVAVEYFAVLLSLPMRRSYLPIKAALALTLYPLKYLDRVTDLSPETDRVAGGYFVVATKPHLDAVVSPLNSGWKGTVAGG